VLKQFSPKANFGDLSYDFVQQFDLYMGKVRGNAIGGKFTRHKCLKAIINEAIKKKFMALENNPYRYFKIKASIGKRNFLSIDEVKKLMIKEIPEKNTLLHKVRDLFLFSCFTGLRYSDVMNLKFENIKSDPEIIKLTMSKTGKDIAIPLTGNAKAIIAKYSKLVIKVPQSKVLPQITNQVINRSLKDLIGITRPISFHCGRHTFASNHIQAQTNIIYVKDLLGHSKLTEHRYMQKPWTAIFSAPWRNCKICIPMLS
jgi:integrase